MQTQPLQAVGTERENRALIWRMAVPTFFELLLQTILINIDQYMISSYSPIAVAAIGNVDQILHLVTMTNSMLASATLVMLSQYKGAGDAAREGTLYSLAFFVNLLVGVAVSLALGLLCVPVFRAMRLEPAVLEAARSYMIIVGGSFFVQILLSTFGAFMRSNTFMKQVMVVSVAMNVLNVIGNYLLIFGNLGFPELGIRGAAIATAGSRVIGLAALAFQYRRHVRVPISARRLRPFPAAQLKRLLYLGVPTGLEPLSYNLTQIVIMSFLNGFGLSSVNAYVYVVLFAKFATLHVNAIKQATQVMVGRLCGAGRSREAQSTALHSAKVSAMIAIGAGALLLLLSGPLFSLFTADPVIHTLGRAVLAIDIIRCVARTYNITLIGSLLTTGDVLVPTIFAIASGWLLAVLGGYTLGVALGLGLVGIYVMVTADEWVRATFCFVRWRRGRWMHRNMVGE